MKKNIICISIIGTLLFSNVTDVMASYLFVDNVKVENSNIQIKQNRSFMALRPISEKAGYTVDYDDATKTITVGDKFKHTVGTSYIIMNDGEIIDIGVPSYIFEGTTYVSTRLFSEGLGFDIEYDDKTKDIYIDTNTISDEEYAEAITETYDEEYSEDLITGMVDAVNQDVISKRNIFIDTFKRNMSGLLIDDAAKVKFANSEIRKQGSTTSLDGSKQHGLNSAILVREGGDLTAENILVNTKSVGSTGLFVDNSTAKVSKSAINTYGDNSKGVVVNNNGKVTLNNTDITTSAHNSDTTVKDAKLLPSAKNSEPIEVLENSNITVNNGTLTTTNNNVLSLLSNATFNGVTANVSGGNIVKAVGDVEFTAKNSDLKSDKTGFNISSTNKNDKAVFNIDNTKVDVGRNVLFDVKSVNADINLKNSEFKNGSTLVRFVNDSDDIKTLNLVLDRVNASGNVVVSENTTSNIKINSGATLTGSINNENTDAEVILDIAPSGALYLTGESNVTVVNPNTKIYDNIYSNGYRIYYDETDSRNAWLDNNTYNLKGGGKLIPKYYKNYLEKSE